MVTDGHWIAPLSNPVVRRTVERMQTLAPGVHRSQKVGKDQVRVDHAELTDQAQQVMTSLLQLAPEWPMVFLTEEAKDVDQLVDEATDGDPVLTIAGPDYDVRISQIVLTMITLGKPSDFTYSGTGPDQPVAVWSKKTKRLAGIIRPLEASHA